MIEKKLEKSGDQYNNLQVSSTVQGGVSVVASARHPIRVSQLGQRTDDRTGGQNEDEMISRQKGILSLLSAYVLRG